QAGGNRTRTAYRWRDWQLDVAPQRCREVVALDVRHRDVLDAVELPDVVDADDVLVRHLAGEEQFLLQPVLGLGRRAFLRIGANHLQRDRDAELGIPRLVDGAHAADAEQLDDVIPRTNRL